MNSRAVVSSIAVLLLVVMSLGAWLGHQRSDEHRKDEGHDTTRRSSPFTPKIISNRTDGILHVGEGRQCKGGACQADHGSGNAMDSDDEDDEDGGSTGWLPLKMYGWSVPTRRLLRNNTHPTKGSLNGGNDTAFHLWGTDSSEPYLRTESGCKEKITDMAFCKRYPTSMPAIVEGVHLAVDEANRVLKQRRWDATALKKASVGQNLVRKATKESAFTHAIIAAGITHSVTKACSRNEIGGCGCATNNNKLPESEDGISWDRCNDNAIFGANVSAQFLKTMEGGSQDLHTIVNLHNNKAGRLSVINELKVECKCHGTSGSCSLKTCWKTLGPFNSIGNHIVRQYDHAVQVAMDNHNRQADTPLRVVSRFFISNRQPERFDLVFYERSPEYCVRNKNEGSLGTKGRKCKRESQGTDSCLHLCCGRGFRLKHEIETFQCNCVFTWCCRVECKTCKKREEYHVCR